MTVCILTCMHTCMHTRGSGIHIHIHRKEVDGGGGEGSEYPRSLVSSSMVYSWKYTRYQLLTCQNFLWGLYTLDAICCLCTHMHPQTHTRRERHRDTETRTTHLRSFTCVLSFFSWHGPGPLISRNCPLTVRRRQRQVRRRRRRRKRRRSECSQIY